MGKGGGSCDNRPGLSLGGGNVVSDALGKAVAGVGSVIESLSNTGSSSYDQYHQEADERSRQAGKDGTYKKDDFSGKLDRPYAKCIECDNIFRAHEAFHWTDKGPVHGWGKYGLEDSCGFAKDGGESRTTSSSSNHSSNSSKGGDKKYLRCGECNMIIYKDQAFHYLENGDAVHGKGTKKDPGTCLYAYNEQLSSALNQVAQDFFEGKLDPTQVMQYMEETQETEEAMSKHLDEAEARFKESRRKGRKKHSSSSNGSQTSLKFDDDLSEDEVEDLANLLDDIMELGKLDITIKELEDKEPEFCEHWQDYLKDFEDDTKLDEVYDQIQDRMLAVDDDVIEGSAVDLGAHLDGSDPCWCASGRKFEDCHGADDDDSFMPTDDMAAAAYAAAYEEEPLFDDNDRQ